MEYSIQYFLCYSGKFHYLRESLKLVEIFDAAEELQTDTWRNDEQTHGEQDQTAQLLAGTKDLKRDYIR